MATKAVPYTDLRDADLIVDATYASGLNRRQDNNQRLWQDPLPSLLGVKASGGFRVRGGRGKLSLALLYSDFRQKDWPDTLDGTLGLWTYYGDNRSPGRALHATAGNVLLAEWFAHARGSSADRRSVPPIFVFTKGGRGKDVVFRGLVVPGTPQVPPPEWLIAIWRTSDGQRFQNYRAMFSVLNVGVVDRSWIRALEEGQPSDHLAPEAWLRWVQSGSYSILRAPVTSPVRTKAAQLPEAKGDHKILSLVFDHFAERPHEFEHFASEIAQRMDANVTSIDVTRPSRDGGRDAIGLYRIGTESSSISVEFALEAKCYKPGQTSLGVKDVSRLISRLRHRQFGIVVTTSFVGQQAYEEIIEDGHPVVVLSGVDIVEILKREFGGHQEVATYLEQSFPRDGESLR